MGNENGSTRAERLAAFLERYEQRAYHVALRLCRNRDEAEDLVQETCYRALRHWDRFDSTRSFEGWFMAVLKHAFIDRRRRADRRCRSLDIMLVTGDSEARQQGLLTGEEKPILEMLVHEETLGLVREAFQALRPRHREVLALCDLAGMQHDAVADKLGIPPGTARSRISRARQELRAVFMRRNPDWSARVHEGGA